jgi:hypothetical protein
MNMEKYPWLSDLDSPQARIEITQARQQYLDTGATIFANFITNQALQSCIEDAQKQEPTAYTTNTVHTAYLKSKDLCNFTESSIYNYEMQTQVASIAFDELSPTGILAQLYRNPILLQLVSRIVHGDDDENSDNDDNGNKQQRSLYLSDDPLGCCSINVFRPNYHHSFHFDESEFSTTLMLQEAQDLDSGLFQYTSPPIRESPDDWCLNKVALTVATYDERCRCHDDDNVQFHELLQQRDQQQKDESSSLPLPLPSPPPPPALATLDFRPGTLSIFSGSRSLHRVTTVRGNVSRLTAVLTFATHPGFCNSPAVQKLFWGRSSSSSSSPSSS